MTTMEKTRLKIRVRLEHDDDTESPIDCDVFKLVTFGMGLIYDGEPPELDPEMAGKTWWPLSCYRHGGSSWSIRGQESYVCPWDTTMNAGVLYLPSNDPSDVGKDSQAAAESFIECYNQWSNGDCWWYKVEIETEVLHVGCCPTCETPDVNWLTTETEEVDSCGGFIGLEHCMEELVSAVKYRKEQKPEIVNTHEVVVSGDHSGDLYSRDVENNLRELGFRIEGDTGG